MQLWFQDEARVGNKRRLRSLWWLRGQRPPGLGDRGYQWAYIFSALHPDSGADFTLVLPAANAAVMQLFLDRFAATLEAEVHAVLVLDGAGWHDPRALRIPDNITLVLLPPYSPELNPVERLRLYFRERFFSFRLLADTQAIIEACCQAWRQLTSNPDTIEILCNYPWTQKVSS